MHRAIKVPALRQSLPHPA